MATKPKKKPKLKTTPWQIGQPLAFPPRRTGTNIDRMFREVVEEAVRGPFRAKRPRRKKK